MRKKTLRRRQSCKRKERKSRKSRKSRRQTRGGRAPIVNNNANRSNNVSVTPMFNNQAQVQVHTVFDANDFGEYLGEKIIYLLENQVNAHERDEMKDEIITLFTSMPFGEQMRFNGDAFIIPDELDFSSKASVENLSSKLYSFMAGH